MNQSNQSPVTVRHALAYVGLIVLGVMLASFGQQLSSGAVPLPREWSWLVPVLMAGILALTTLLPRVTDLLDSGGQQPSTPTIPPTGPIPSVADSGTKGHIAGTKPLPTVPPPPAPAPNPAPSFVPENVNATAAVAPPAAGPADVTR